MTFYFDFRSVNIFAMLREFNGVCSGRNLADHLTHLKNSKNCYRISDLSLDKCLTVSLCKDFRKYSLRDHP